MKKINPFIEWSEQDTQRDNMAWLDRKLLGKSFTALKNNLLSITSMPLCISGFVFSRNSQWMLIRLMFFILKNKFPIQKWDSWLSLHLRQTFLKVSDYPGMHHKKKKKQPTNLPLLLWWSASESLRKQFQVIRSVCLTADFPQASPSLDVQRWKIAKQGILFPPLSIW